MPSLRHLPKPSGRIWMAILIPTVIVIVMIVGILRPSSSDPTKQTAAPSPSAATSTKQEPTIPDPGDTVSDADIGGLAEALYRFEEIINLPPSAERDASLKAMSTPAGYQSLIGSEATQDVPVDDRAKGISFLALRSATDVIQAEPFDETSVSVSSEIRVQSSRNGEVIQTFTVKRLTTWSRINGVWKFEGEQY